MQPEDIECSKTILKRRAIVSAIDFKNKAGNPSGVLKHFGGERLHHFNIFSHVNVTESSGACTGACCKALHFNAQKL